MFAFKYFSDRFRRKKTAFAVVNQKGRMGDVSGASFKALESRVLMSASSIFPATIPLNANTGNTGGDIRIESGTGAFNGVSDSSDTVTVAAGANISGQVTLAMDNIENGSAVAPLIVTPSWGNPQTSWQTINPWIPTGQSNETASVSLTAPTTPGVYHLNFAFEWELTGDQVASGTNWGVGKDTWGDGNDIATLTTAQIQKAQLNGYTEDQWLFTSGCEHQYVPMDSITIDVVGPTVPAANNIQVTFNNSVSPIASVQTAAGAVISSGSVIAQGPAPLNVELDFHNNLGLWLPITVESYGSVKNVIPETNDPDYPLQGFLNAFGVVNPNGDVVESATFTGPGGVVSFLPNGNLGQVLRGDAAAAALNMADVLCDDFLDLPTNIAGLFGLVTELFRIPDFHSAVTVLTRSANPESVGIDGAIASYDLDRMLTNGSERKELVKAFVDFADGDISEQTISSALGGAGDVFNLANSIYADFVKLYQLDVVYAGSVGNGGITFTSQPGPG